jgi:hypothetical protein
MVFSLLEQGRNCPMVQKKHKVLMTDEETGDKFILVDEYPVTRYKCGLKAGDQVRLKKDLVGFDHKYRPTGKVDPKGQIWTVLKGSIVNGNLEFNQFRIAVSTVIRSSMQINEKGDEPASA